MTFMEQRKRYRKEYEKVVNDKLETKFNSLSKEEQEKLMKDLEKIHKFKLENLTFMKENKMQMIKNKSLSKVDEKFYELKNNKK